MTEDLHDNDELYRKAYHRYEEEPSPDVWDKLNTRLNKQDVAKRRAAFASWWRVAAVILLLLGSAAAYLIVFKPKAETSSASIKKEVQKTSTNDVKQLPSSAGKQPLDIKTDSPDAADAATPAIMERKPKEDKSGKSSLKDSSEAFNKQNYQPPYSSNKTTIDEVVKQEQTGVKRKQAKTNSVFGEKDANTIKDLQKNESTASNIAQKEDKRDVKPSKQEAIGAEKDSNNFQSSSVKTTAINSAVAVDAMQDSVVKNSSIDVKKLPIKIGTFSKPRFSLLPYGAADFAMRHMDNDEHHRDPDRRDDRHEIEEREKALLSFSTGILVRYELNKNFSIKSGLVYSNTAVQINPETLYAAPDNNREAGYKYITSLGYAYVKPSFDQRPALGDSIHSGHGEQHASYLSVPLMVSYTIGAGKKLSILPGAGFTTHMLLGSKLETEVKKGNDENKLTIRKMNGLATVYFSFTADAELHYHLSHRFSLMLLPSFKYAIVPNTNNHVVKTYPYNFGVGAGFTYGL